MKTINTVIVSIPGIISIDGIMISGEIGNINRFSKPSKLFAYAGLVPTIYQYGKFKASYNV